LTSLKDLKVKLPEVAAKMTEEMWTNEAEETLIEMFWEKPA
jgi:hypothetical protein